MTVVATVAVVVEEYFPWMRIPHIQNTDLDIVVHKNSIVGFHIAVGSGKVASVAVVVVVVLLQVVRIHLWKGCPLVKMSTLTMELIDSCQYLL